MSKDKTIKQEIHTLIENEGDPSILKAIRTILKKINLDPVLKGKLSTRALKAERDIKKNYLLDRTKLERKLNEKLGI